ncbi:peptidoglycan/LPS O-acetylase OafA/YrhL [Dyadobacter arcticus]|uniref:Peptidoglycan/LPS O-acetylase OafA/YrhL n=1 Tax=Dyadobacter arcticus TaxID=1078754 RepID=A0ABX0UVK7_9BACT|nr:peptidoglycan/LPS O-acetylase OafA/YrhL [Dyadobacter arcticus]
MFLCTSPSRLSGRLAFLVEDIVKTRYSRVIAIAGYATIFCCFNLLDENLPWPGTYTLLADLGTFLIICVNINSFKLLRNEAVLYLRKVS